MGRDVTGVLLMAYGSPDSLEDVEAYYTHIRRGRKPAPEQVEELAGRYRAIGGSPLNKITGEVAAALGARLNDEPSQTFQMYIGMKHWHPYIEASVDRMAADGVHHAVALALAPQYSRMSVEGYLKVARERAVSHGIELTEVRDWHTEPLFIELLADRIHQALNRVPQSEREGVQVVFTAHSLPERILQWNDPYPAQLEATCEAAAQAAGVTGWRFAYQSASHTSEPWLGPDILDLLDQLHAGGKDAVLVCPVGFVTDHLEILYDIGIEAKERADALGMQLERTESLNTDPRFIEALAHVVQIHIDASGRDASAWDVCERKA